MSRAYQTLLGLYPRDYRDLFGAEMWDAFEKAADEHRRQGWPVFARFVVAEWADLMSGAAAEWIAKLTTDSSVRGRCLPDLRMMRPPSVPRDLWFAGASMGVSQSSAPDEMIEAEERIAILISRMVHAIANHDFLGARSYSYEEREARENLRRLREKYRAGPRG
jgi:hypothetical protein